jgi:hypothetical protein
MKEIELSDGQFGKVDDGHYDSPAAASHAFSASLGGAEIKQL